MTGKNSTEATPLPTVDQIKSRREPKRSVNDRHEESLTMMERYAIWITDHVGTMGFFLIIMVWTAVWMGWNYTAKSLHLPGVFDRPWEFAIWLFVSNLIQLHLMPLIMVGQNLQGQHSEIRAEEEYRMVQQTEHETEIILRYLETSNRHLRQIEQRLDAMEQKLCSST